MRRLRRHLRRAAGSFDAFLGTISPLGRTVVALGVLVWISGAVWGWEELLVVAGAALVLFGMALVFTVGRLDLAASIRVEPARVVVGDRAAGEVHLENRRGRGVRNLRVELPVGRAVAVFSVAHLRRHGTTDELFVVPTHRRAVIPVGPLTTVQGDPIGIARRTRRWSEVEEIYVHPKTVPLSTMAAGLIRDMEGQTTTALSPSDVAFHTLREYVPGDDLRHVHWKSSAKMGELMVRQYNDTRRSHVAVLVSTDPDEYADEDEYELSISCAASVAVQARRDEQTLSVFAGRHELPSPNPTRLLDRFSAIEGVTGQGGVEDAVKLARRLAPDASVAVICVGSRLGVPEVRRATTRAALETGAVVLRASLLDESSYRVVGNMTFVDVPSLDSLGRGVRAVVT